MAEQIIGLQALNRRLAAVSGVRAGEPIMRRLAIATVREAKLLVPRRTGDLGRSIHVASVTPSEAVVIASASYAGFVEFGTRPHEITPRAKKALRFAASPGGARLTGTPRKGAAVIFAKRVHHPGTAPHPFMLLGARKAVTTSGLDQEVVAAWNGAA